MVDELRVGLQELLRKAQIEDDADFLKEGMRVLSQMLMEMEIEQHIGASRHERSPAGRICSPTTRRTARYRCVQPSS